MSKHTKAAKLAAIPVIAVVAALISPMAAQAETYDVDGTLNTSGSLVQYSTFRSHVSGSASMKITNNVATYSRFGLRNTSGAQITNSSQFNESGGDQPFTLERNGSRTIPTGTYALNGRMGEKKGVGADNYWAGQLTL